MVGVLFRVLDEHTVQNKIRNSPAELINNQASGS